MKYLSNEENHKQYSKNYKRIMHIQQAHSIFKSYRSAKLQTVKTLLNFNDNVI